MKPLPGPVFALLAVLGIVALRYVTELLVGRPWGWKGRLIYYGTVGILLGVWCGIRARR